MNKITPTPSPPPLIPQKLKNSKKFGNLVTSFFVLYKVVLMCLGNGCFTLKDTCFLIEIALDHGG